MKSSSKQSTTIRRGRPEDIEAILNLLTEYDLPRSYFETFYLNDSSYRPEHSWVVEQQGRLLSHLRVYDRWIRVDRAKLRIAGIGNVITTHDARGQSYTGQMIHAILPVLHQEGYAYSLLWTHLPHLYGRYGWVAIEQEQVRARTHAPTGTPAILHTVAITPFAPQDLADVMLLYETANAECTGTTIRSTAYWREQPAWLHEDLQLFLLARDTITHALLGYVRGQAAQHAVEVLELALAESRFDIGHLLLAQLSAQQHRPLQGHFPPSQRPIFRPGEFAIHPATPCMGRVINLAALIQALEPQWNERTQAARTPARSLILATGSGQKVLDIRNAHIQASIPHGAVAAPLLSERELAHLLLRGFDVSATKLLGDRPDESVLRTLFPEQDFVIWLADVF